MISSFPRLGAAVVLVALLMGACAGDDSAGADDASEATTSTTGATTSTTSPPTRAIVVPSTVPPLLSSTSTTEVDPNQVALDELQIGDCVDIADAPTDVVEVGTARRLDCAEPHGLEVFHVQSLNPDPAAPYPGDEAVLTGTDQMCLDAFEPYVGIAYVDSSLEIAHLRPDENVWLLGDRAVRCVVQDRGLEPLVGSVRGSGR